MKVEELTLECNTEQTNISDKCQNLSDISENNAQIEGANGPKFCLESLTSQEISENNAQIDGANGPKFCLKSLTSQEVPEKDHSIHRNPVIQ